VLIVVAAATLLAGGAGAAAAAAVRIGDIGHIDGVRQNQLMGYGLVVGLNGTGDGKGTGFTSQSISNMLEHLGLNVPKQALKVRNVAAVLVTTELPPFARPGTRIDVTVSSIGDASSLEGGMLVQTPLKAANDSTYAVAQGPLSIGGFSAAGAGGNAVSRGHVTVGRIPGGAIIERAVPAPLVRSGRIRVVLDEADFRTASRVAAAINREYGGARPLDASTVDVQVPDHLGRHQLVDFLANVESLTIMPVEHARVVINERTGTVIAGGSVQILPVAISHGGLTVRVRTRQVVSQPQPFSELGETVVVPEGDVAVEESTASLAYFDQAATIQELATALNTLGVTPRDLIAIFQALKQAGALQAELIIM
jgi:flagellar P-ring protein precursor FlgI